VGHERDSSSGQSVTRAEARTLADREPEEVLDLEELPVEEEDEPLGWLISLLVEANTSESASDDRDPAPERV
jgi:hypothetical protein